MAEQTKLSLLDLESFCAHLPIVNDSKIFKNERLQQYSETGLFSPIIFGSKGSEKYHSAYACIDLRVKIFNPVVFSILIRLDQKIKDIVNQDLGFNVTKEGAIELAERDAEHYGIVGLITVYNSLEFRVDTPDRTAFANILKNNKKKLFTSKIPIIPPDRRPIYPNRQTGDFMPDELNEYYIKIIKVCRSIPSNLDGFDELTRSTFVSKIQLAYNNLYEFIKLKLGKKTGYYRSNLLGKRVDHSGRGVIVGDPEMPPNKMGITMRIAVRIFEPFILHSLLQQEKIYFDMLSQMYPKEDYLDKCKKVLKDISQNMIKSDSPLYGEIKKIVIQVSKDRMICAKRDPALHRDSWRAFEPVIVDGSVLRINNAVCEGLNADFDGDSNLSNILLFVDGKEVLIHISDIENSGLVEKIKTKIKDSGIIVTKFKPIKDISIKAIDLSTGDIDNKKITEYSKHENLEMFKLHDDKNRFEDFWVSMDHSLIVYDEKDGCLKKITPNDLLLEPDGKYLVKK
ncbi:hypothetical protein M0R36_10160 [bacterium]|jgi:hypothetical protein|nr:hypothetical protein [bacterium]